MSAASVRLSAKAWKFSKIIALRSLEDSRSFSSGCVFSTDRNKITNWESVVGEAKRSPFDNPEKVYRGKWASQLNVEPVMQNSTKCLSTSQTTQEPDHTTDKCKETQNEDRSPNNSNEVEEAEKILVQRGPLSRLWHRINEKFGTNIDDSMSEAEKKTRRTARSVTLGLIAIFAFGGVYVIFWLYYTVREKRDPITGALIKDQYSDMSFYKRYYNRIVYGIHEWKTYFVEPSREQLLPSPLEPPYFQPKYTLVIEFKNILMAPEWTYNSGHRFKKRPALDYFLEIAGYPNFELVIYTGENGMTAQPLLEQMDTKHKVMYQLYRDCTKTVKGHFAKDLSRLNRDLSKVIYIDFDPNSYQLNPENVLRVPKWEGDMNDTGLVDMAELLKVLYMSDVDDVRPTLQYYSQFDNPLAEFRRAATSLADQQKKAEEEKTKANSKSLLQQATGRFFGSSRHRAV